MLLVFFLVNRKEDMMPRITTSMVHSASPSLSPSVDLRPTIEIVQTRGRLLCGINDNATSDNVKEFRMDLVRAQFFMF